MSKITPSINELCFNILNIAKTKTTIQEPISLAQIKFNVLAIRALLIKQELNKNYTPDSSTIQTLECVNVKLVDSSECSCILTGCKLLRTVEKIPSVIEGNYTKLLTRVGPVGIDLTPFSIISYSRVPYYTYNDFTNKKTVCFLHNGYLYFLGENIKLLKKVNIQGVFENPEDVSSFLNCGNEPCYSEDSAFPVKYSMVPIITQMVLEKFMPQTQTIDDSNDGSINPRQVTK
jgi:hypothetical protein